MEGKSSVLKEEVDEEDIAHRFEMTGIPVSKMLGG